MDSALNWPIVDGGGRNFIACGDNKGVHSVAVASIERKCGYALVTNSDGCVVIVTLVERLNLYFEG